MPATMTCTAVANKQPAPARFCRWVLGREISREMLLAGSATPLYVQTTTKAGIVTTEYFVIKQEASYLLMKEVAGEVVKTYTIDMSFDENPDFWCCSCPQATHRNPNCKHKLSLIAGLRKLELLNV